jgi:hypothetical protein
MVKECVRQVKTSWLLLAGCLTGPEYSTLNLTRVRLLGYTASLLRSGEVCLVHFHKDQVVNIVTARNRQIHRVWTVRTSQETLHVPATEHNRLMLCGETVAVCCENRTEHTDTLCGQSVPHRRHHVSTTEPTRLMLCGETVAVCCENRAEDRSTLSGKLQSS